MKRMRGPIRITTTNCDCSQIDQQQVGTPGTLRQMIPGPMEYTTCDRHIYEHQPCRLFRGVNKINTEDTGMHSFQTCNDLVMCVLRDDSVGIGRIPAGFQCTYFFSWNHDTT